MASKRRYDSGDREEIKKQLTQSLEMALDRLQNIWDEIGIVKESRQDRIRVVMKHLCNLMEEMVTEEETLKTSLMKNVHSYGEELLKLCKELSLPEYEPNEGLSVLQLEKELRSQVGILAKEKHSRIKRLKSLKETDQHLCDVLCTTPYYIPSGTVPSVNQLSTLETHIAELMKEKERRYNIFKNTKDSISKLMEELEQCPNSSFERDIIHEEEDSFLLSSDNMKALKVLQDELEQRQKDNFSQASKLRERVHQLWERLKCPAEERMKFSSLHTGFKPKTIDALKEEIGRLELLKLQNMKQVIEATRKELDAWWIKCYYSSEQKDMFIAFNSEEFTEELLEEHEREVDKLKAYYEQYQDMFTKVERRQVLWKDFLEFERKAADPNRFGNRGGNLLKEEKARKKLMKELPRVEQEVKEQIEEWERQNEKEFLVEGNRFMDYINKQWETYQVQKQDEKNKRHNNKAKMMEDELMFGSKPTTPAKRRFIGTTPSKTPNKMRKINDTRTPGSMSKLYTSRTPSHSSLFMSPACMPPRSASKTPRRPLTASKDTTRKALSEKNGSNHTMFSHTTVSSNPSSDVSTASVASVGAYNEFATALNHNGKQNCRSSVAPKGVYL